MCHTYNFIHTIVVLKFRGLFGGACRSWRMTMARRFVFFLMLACLYGGTPIEAIEATKQRELQIYLMPHTHCDVGYKKTFEGYFLTEVRPILHSVTAALQANPSRRFIWSEVAYLKRWYEGPTTAEDVTAQHAFRSLVDRGQIELIDGGFTQHDDACTTLAQQLQIMLGSSGA